MKEREQTHTRTPPKQRSERGREERTHKQSKYSEITKINENAVSRGAENVLAKQVTGAVAGGGGAATQNIPVGGSSSQNSTRYARSPLNLLVCFSF